MRIQEKEIGMV